MGCRLLLGLPENDVLAKPRSRFCEVENIGGLFCIVSLGGVDWIEWHLKLFQAAAIGKGGYQPTRQLIGQPDK